MIDKTTARFVLDQDAARAAIAASDADLLTWSQENLPGSVRDLLHECGEAFRWEGETREPMIEMDDDGSRDGWEYVQFALQTPATVKVASRWQEITELGDGPGIEALCEGVYSVEIGVDEAVSVLAAICAELNTIAHAHELIALAGCNYRFEVA